MTTKNIRATFASAALATILALTGCASAEAPAPTSSPTGASKEQSHDHQQGEVTEAAGPTPRVVVTYEGGVMVLDSATLEVIADYQLDGFNRLNAAGDGRHVLVSTAGGWALLDTGTWTEPHGDHTHSYTTQPEFYEHR